MTGADFACNRRLVHGGNSFDDLAVGRYRITGLDQNHIADLQLWSGHHLVVSAIRSGQELRAGLGTRAPERIRLGLAAAFGNGFGEVREQHREP